MNQLQNLLHDALIATSHVERCALLNKEEYSVRAASVGYQVEKHSFIWLYILLSQNLRIS